MPCPSDEIIESIKECKDPAKLVKIYNILVNKIQYDDDYNYDNDDYDEQLMEDFMEEENIDPNIFLTKTKSDKELEELQREMSKDDSYDSDDSDVEDLIAKMKDVYGIDDSEIKKSAGGSLKKRKKSKRKKKSKSSKKSKKSTERKKSKTKSKKSKRVKRSRTKKNKRVKRTNKKRTLRK